MQSYARQVFESVIAEARPAGANELRLVSGRMPVLVFGTQTRTIGRTELSAALVRDIHLECLTMAKQETPPGGSTFAYRIASSSPVEQARLRGPLGEIMGRVWTDPMHPIVREFPDLDPDK